MYTLHNINKIHILISYIYKSTTNVSIHPSGFYVFLYQNIFLTILKDGVSYRLLGVTARQMTAKLNHLELKVLKECEVPIYRLLRVLGLLHIK